MLNLKSSFQNNIMIELFEDQADFANRIVYKIASGVKKICCQLPTGGGKTVIFSNLSLRYWAKFQKPVLIFVHREELLRQTRRTLHGMGISAVPIVAGMKHIPPAQVYVGMVESTFRRLHKLQEIGMVIIDEAHIGVFNKLHAEFPGSVVLGFTATPITANRRKPMKLYYDDIICGPTISQLIRLKRLCQNITYAPKDAVDRAALIMKGDEFDENFMAQKFSKPKYITNTVAAYERWGRGKKTVVFNCNIAHSRVVNDAFVQAGYNSRQLDSHCSEDERVEILKWFSITPDAILNNVAIATTGFDEPSIETVIINRATASMPLWIQMTGRGSRTTEWKDMFTIVDMGANAITHGDWCQDRDWDDLFWNVPKPGKGGVPPFKNCIACEAVIYAGVMKCPVCGSPQPKSAVPVEAVMNEFVIVTKNIDIDVLVRRHNDKKQYYPFFLLGRILAESAFKSASFVTDEIAIFTLTKYNELAKKWAHSQGKPYNKWHQGKAQEILFKELKRLDPEWESKLFEQEVYDNQND